MSSDSKANQVEVPAEKRSAIGVSKINVNMSLSHVSKIIIESRQIAQKSKGYMVVVNFFFSYQIPILLIIAVIWGLSGPEAGNC